jgi:hypothetical protein
VFIVVDCYTLNGVVTTCTGQASASPTSPLSSRSGADTGVIAIIGQGTNNAAVSPRQTGPRVTVNSGDDRRNDTRMCPTCDLKFMRRDNAAFKRHLTIHSDANLACNRCDKRYTSSRSLRRHQRDVHHPTIAKCSQCRCIFTSPRSLHRHVKQCHTTSSVGRLIVCGECGITCTRPYDLRRHQARKHRIVTGGPTVYDHAAQPGLAKVLFPTSMGTTACIPTGPL